MPTEPSLVLAVEARGGPRLADRAEHRVLELADRSDGRRLLVLPQLVELQHRCARHVRFGESTHDLSRRQRRDLGSHRAHDGGAARHARRRVGEVARFVGVGERIDQALPLRGR